MGKIDIILEEAEEAKREASGAEDETPGAPAPALPSATLVTGRSHGDTEISRYSQQFEFLSMHRDFTARSFESKQC